MTYIVNPGKGYRITLVEDFSAMYFDKTKYQGNSIMGIPVRESTGKVDKSRIHLFCERGPNRSIQANATGVKRLIRKLRPDEQSELEEVNAQIEALHEQRKEILQRAWQKAHVVTLKEVVEKIK